jgi:hypothetical protein
MNGISVGVDERRVGDASAGREAAPGVEFVTGTNGS